MPFVLTSGRGGQEPLLPEQDPPGASGGVGLPRATSSASAGAGAPLTSEASSSQKPSHQLLKAVLPIMRTKSVRVKRERR